MGGGGGVKKGYTQFETNAHAKSTPTSITTPKTKTK